MHFTTEVVASLTSEKHTKKLKKVNSKKSQNCKAKPDSLFQKELKVNLK